MSARGEVEFHIPASNTPISYSRIQILPSALRAQLQLPFNGNLSAHRRQDLAQRLCTALNIPIVKSTLTHTCHYKVRLNFRTRT